MVVLYEDGIDAMPRICALTVGFSEKSAVVAVAFGEDQFDVNRLSLYRHHEVVSSSVQDFVIEAFLNFYLREIGRQGQGSSVRLAK